jgi:hypothetical protein
MRISQSVRIGPLRVGISGPVGHRGRAQVWAMARDDRRGWLGVSTPVGGRKPWKGSGR